MEDPVKEIPAVIAALTKGEAEDQRRALNSYFLPNASFSHQLRLSAREGVPVANGIDSLWVILAVYRWYRTLSPHIDITVDSSVFEKDSGLLYVSLRQTFSLWFLSLYKAPVRLVSVLQLTQCNVTETLSESDAYIPLPAMRRSSQVRYFIASQEDLYPVNDCLQLLVPGLGSAISFAWHLYTAWLCIMGSLFLLPIYLIWRRRPRRSIKWLLKA